jgi:hypothetical protein
LKEIRNVVYGITILWSLGWGNRAFMTIRAAFLFFASLLQCLMIFTMSQTEGTNETHNSLAGKATEETLPAVVIRLPIGTFDPLSRARCINLPENLTIEDYPTEAVGYYLLQFRGPVLKEWKDAVINAGGEFFDYIPDFTFIVKMGKKAKVQVEGMEPVRWVGIYQPAYRISLELMQFLTKGNEERQIDIIITIFRGELLRDLMEKIKGIGGSILDVSKGKWKGKIKARIETQKLIEIARTMGVKWIERAPEFKLSPTL